MKLDDFRSISNITRVQLKNVKDVEQFAIKAHGNQMYGDKPYSYHLRKVAYIIECYYPKDHNLFLGAWLHDVIEDTEVTRLDIEKKFGVDVGNIVWACSGFGKNRKEKQDCIKMRLLAYPRAWPVKVADRIANIAANIEEGRKDKFLMYLNEHDEFFEACKDDVNPAMLTELTMMIEEGKRAFNV